MRTIEQIDAELEVLRNELDMLKAEARPKKKIEFVKYLNGNGTSLSDTSFSPNRFEFIRLLYSYDNCDIMEAFHDEDSTDKFVFTGHFNDGIK